MFSKGGCIGNRLAHCAFSVNSFNFFISIFEISVCMGNLSMNSHPGNPWRKTLPLVYLVLNSCVNCFKINKIDCH